jgi:hypothetical protein
MLYGILVGLMLVLTVVNFTLTIVFGHHPGGGRLRPGVRQVLRGDACSRLAS